MNAKEFLIYSDFREGLANVCTNRARLQTLHEGCRRYPNLTSSFPSSDKPLYWRLLADDKHHVLYCVIPKAGCTSFKTMMVNQTQRLLPNTTIRVHDSRKLHSVGLAYLSAYRTRGIRRRLKTYTKVIVVRHPFDRLLSAYKDKFVSHRIFSRVYLRLIAETIGLDHVTHNGRIMISLEQFLDLVRRGHDGGFRNRHWLPYTELCHPCHIQYDHILKLETLESDSKNVLSLFLNQDRQPVTLPHLNGQRSASGKLQIASDTFRELDPALVKSIVEIYQGDFDLFGYGWDSYFGASCSGNFSAANCC